MSDEKKRGLGFRIGLSLVAFVVSSLLAEGVARLLEPRPYAKPRMVGWDRTEYDLSEVIGFLRDTGKGEQGKGSHSGMGANIKSRQCYDRPQWKYFDSEGCIDVNLNSLGFRDLEFTLEKPEGELRVLAIGDSFTFGNGVRLEDTWVQQLEGLLRERHGKAEVINAGFAGGEHRPSGYAGWLEHDGLLLAPDIVIVGFCLNDMGNIPMAILGKDPIDAWLGGKSVLLRHIQGALHRAKYEERTLDVARRVDREPEIWLATQEGLRRIRDLCVARGVRFVVAVFPMISQLDGNYPFRRLHEMVADFCTREGIERVDLLPRFLGRHDRDLWVHPTDQHPNDIGHRLIAEGIFEYLETPR